jgi:hypothetical protein
MDDKFRKNLEVGDLKGYMIGAVYFKGFNENILLWAVLTAGRSKAAVKGLVSKLSISDAKLLPAKGWSKVLLSTKK